MEKILIVSDDARFHEKVKELCGACYSYLEAESLAGAHSHFRHNQFNLVFLDKEMFFYSEIPKFLKYYTMHWYPAEIIIMDKEAQLPVHVNKDGPPPGVYDSHSSFTAHKSPVSSSAHPLVKSHNESLCAYCMSFSEKKKITVKLNHRSEIYKMISAASKCDDTVCLIGESGTGKDVYAHEIHVRSSRRDKPYCILDLKTQSDSLMESELFGYVKGAFTGAAADHKGKVETAEGGTLYLPEFNSLKPSIQDKIMNLVDNKIFFRVGSSVPVKANVRIIAGWTIYTSATPEEYIVREDLVGRIMVIPIAVLPLRFRKNEIPQIVVDYLSELSAENNRPGFTLSRRAMWKIKNADWPGNIRQLKSSLKLAAGKNMHSGSDKIHISENDICVYNSNPEEFYRMKLTEAATKENREQTPGT